MKRVASKARVKGTVVPGNEMIPREVVTINSEGTVEVSPGYDIEEAIDPKTGIAYYFSASTGRSAWSREELVAGGFHTFDSSKRSMLLDPDRDPEACAETYVARTKLVSPTHVVAARRALQNIAQRVSIVCSSAYSVARGGWTLRDVHGCVRNHFSKLARRMKLSVAKGLSLEAAPLPALDRDTRRLLRLRCDESDPFSCIPRTEAAAPLLWRRQVVQLFACFERAARVERARDAKRADRHSAEAQADAVAHRSAGMVGNAHESALAHALRLQTAADECAPAHTSMPAAEGIASDSAVENSGPMQTISAKMTLALLDVPYNILTAAIFSLANADHMFAAELSALAARGRIPPTSTTPASTHATARVSFDQFVRTIVTLALMSDLDVLHFFFYVLDPAKRAGIRKADLREAVRVLHPTHGDGRDASGGGIRQLASQFESMLGTYNESWLTYQDVRQLNRRFPQLLFPLFRMQRNACALGPGERWWHRRKARLAREGVAAPKSNCTVDARASGPVVSYAQCDWQRLGVAQQMQGRPTAWQTFLAMRRRPASVKAKSETTAVTSSIAERERWEQAVPTLWNARSVIAQRNQTSAGLDYTTPL